jgi:formylglycine-generating enzyme required for sulfatase activity
MKFVPVPGTEILMCIWETRVQDYAAYAAANPGVDLEWKDYEYSGNKQGPDHPVVNVSWEDAQGFCKWLSQKEGKTYRLPTDREWSCAVGIGDQESLTTSPSDLDMKIDGVYSWGAGWPPPKGAGNYHAEEGAVSGLTKISGYRDDHPFTAPVGSYSPNKLGIYDLGGNAYEWCEDEYSWSSRVLRGASWLSGGPGILLSSNRFNRDPAFRDYFIGFRVVVVGVGER